jgi:hypothetical protein
MCMCVCVCVCVCGRVVCMYLNRRRVARIPKGGGLSRDRQAKSSRLERARMYKGKREEGKRVAGGGEGGGGGELLL